jgi:hypothetical protein
MNAPVNIDVNKMPLGNLSKDQVKKGFQVLQEIDDALKSKQDDASSIEELSGRFYTIVGDMLFNIIFLLSIVIFLFRTFTQDAILTA